MAKRKSRTDAEISGKFGKLAYRQGQKRGFHASKGQGRFKIKRKSSGDFMKYANSQAAVNSRQGGSSAKTAAKFVSKNKGNRKQSQISRLEIQKRRNYSKLDRVKGLRSDSKNTVAPSQFRSRNTLRSDRMLRSEQQEQPKLTARVQNNPKSGLKLFTKSFDARKKIEAKRQRNKKSDVEQIKADSKVVLQGSRKQQKSTNLSQKREMSIFGDQVKIVSRFDTEQQREALFTGRSLRVTTLQTAAEKLQQRDASLSGDSFLVTTSSKSSDYVTEKQPDVSEYSLFEARRKAQQAVDAKARQEPQKLSTLNPISRPSRTQPVLHPEGEEGDYASKLLISNLHPSVSQDDIYELFAAIAPLRKVRMIRQGIAEVMYNNHQDAANAYKKYHSRNLDGQPMICKLVASEKPIYSPPVGRHPRSETVTSSNPVVFTVKI